MLRAARFAAQLGFAVAPEVVAAMTGMAERIEIISAERVRDELVKLISAPYPRRGLALLVETGLAARVLPELPALALERDEHHRHKDVYEHTLTVLEQSIDLEDRLPGGGPDFVSRFAALMHDVGKPRTRKFLDDGSVTFHHHDVVGAKITRKRMQALRFSKDEIDAVAKLVELHLRFHGYGSGEWTDSAVRRYVRDAGDQLERLHVLTRADCTTRNRAKAERLRRTYDDLEARIARLREQEELDAIRPDLDGNQIMELLGIPPGRDVGAAYQLPPRAPPRPRPDVRGRRQGRPAGVVGGASSDRRDDPIGWFSTVESTRIRSSRRSRRPAARRGWAIGSGPSTQRWGRRPARASASSHPQLMTRGYVGEVAAHDLDDTRRPTRRKVGLALEVVLVLVRPGGRRRRTPRRRHAWRRRGQGCRRTRHRGLEPPG